MHPLVGNTKGARKYMADDPELVSKIEQIHDKQVEMYHQSNQNLVTQSSLNPFSLSSDSSSAGFFGSGQM